LSPLRRILLNYAEFIIGIICAGENIEYCCTSDTVIINDIYFLLTLHRFTEDCDLSHLTIESVDMSLLLVGVVIIANHITLPHQKHRDSLQSTYRTLWCICNMLQLPSLSVFSRRKAKADIRTFHSAL